MWHATEIRLLGAVGLVLFFAGCSSSPRGTGENHDNRSKAFGPTEEKQGDQRESEAPGEPPEPPPVAQLDESACAERADAMEGWSEGEVPEGARALMYGALALGETWTQWPPVNPPEIERGWRPVTEESAQVAIREDGALSFPSADGRPFRPARDPSSPSESEMRGGIVGTVEDEDRTFVEDGDVERLAPALSEHDGLTRIFAVADGDAPASTVREVREVVSRDIAMSLVVRMPPDAIVERFAAAWPRFPAWLEPRLQAVDLQLGALWKVLMEHHGRFNACDEIAGAFEHLQYGGGMAILGPALAEALRACSCGGVDVDLVEAIAALMTLPIDRIAVVDVWPRDHDAWGDLSRDASVSDLASALAR